MASPRPLVARLAARPGPVVAEPRDAWPKLVPLNTASRHPRAPVCCEVDGRIYRGNYWVAGMILVVSTARGGTSTQLAGRPPLALAETLLRGLVRDAKL